MPYAMTLTSVRASLNTAQTSGSIFTVDINESGSSVLSTKLTIDNTEKHRQPQQPHQLLVMVTWLMMLKLRLILTKSVMVQQKV